MLDVPPPGWWQRRRGARERRVVSWQGGVAAPIDGFRLGEPSRSTVVRCDPRLDAGKGAVSVPGFCVSIAAVSSGGPRDRPSGLGLDASFRAPHDPSRALRALRIRPVRSAREPGRPISILLRPFLRDALGDLPAVRGGSRRAAGRMAGRAAGVSWARLARGGVGARAVRDTVRLRTGRNVPPRQGARFAIVFEPIQPKNSFIKPVSMA